MWFIGLRRCSCWNTCVHGAWQLNTCGLAICGLLLWYRPLGVRQTSALAGVSVLGVAGLITAQILTPAPPTFAVQRYDDVSADARVEMAEAPQEDGLAVVDSEDGVPAPAGDVFAPPGDIFEPPGDTLYSEPPDAAAAAEAVSDQQQDSSGGDASATTAASLLLLLRPGSPLLMQLLSAPADTEEENRSAEEDRSAESAGESNTGEPVAEPERRLIGVTGNRFRLDIRQWPLLGNPEAKYVFVEMFDYTCSHCRNTHRAVRGAFKRYGDDLAIIALPVPLDRKCNSAATSSGGSHRGSCEISRIAVAVWRIDAAKFHELHDWIFETKRTAAATRRQAEQLVGREALTKRAQLSPPPGSTLPGMWICTSGWAPAPFPN